MPRNEADTRAQLIDPQLHARGWTEEFHIRREQTAGKIELIGADQAVRRAARTDYTLRVPTTYGAQPVTVAVVEAKDEDKAPTAGLEQAKRYGRRLNVPFVFSTNGHLFVEHDLSTGRTTEPQGMAFFPAPDELLRRWLAAKDLQIGSEAARPLVTPYHQGEGHRRYYQDAAIRAALEVVAQGRNRALLTLATGAGKTFIAANLLRRIADAGALRRALFVCDRDELRTQAIGAMQALFGEDAAEAKGGDPAKNARVVVATYQTLGIDKEGDESFLTKHYPEGWFSHIVVDEAHRSGFKKWRKVLDMNAQALQVGLTATPRLLDFSAEDIDPNDERLLRDTEQYFGKAVYDYGMGQAFEDGYLAPPYVLRREVFLDRKADREEVTGIEAKDLEGKRIVHAKTGAPLTVKELRKRYGAGALDAELQVPERTRSMCDDLFHQMTVYGAVEDKTIVFCARDEHADRVAARLDELYAQWCEIEGKPKATPYAVKVTAGVQGAPPVADFKGARRTHLVACTVDLLSTGVDVPAVRNIVFFRYLASPILFSQMLGRGSRLDPASGKLSFRVFDYTNATRLMGRTEREAITVEESAETEDAEERWRAPVAVVHGMSVHLRDGGDFVMRGESLVSLADLREELGEVVRRETGDFEGLRAVWVAPKDRRGLVAALPEEGGAALVVRKLDKMEGCDLFDVLAKIAFSQGALTRGLRAGRFLGAHEAWLGAMPARSGAVLTALAGQFERGGTEALEAKEFWQTPDVRKAGGLAALQAAGNAAEVFTEAKRRLFS